MVLRDTLKIRDICMILSHISSSSITGPLFTLKASYLVKWSISRWSFMWWCQFSDLLKFETRPSSLLDFGTACGMRTGVIFSLSSPHARIPFASVQLKYAKNTPVLQASIEEIKCFDFKMYVTKYQLGSCGRMFCHASDFKLNLRCTLVRLILKARVWFHFRPNCTRSVQLPY